MARLQLYYAHPAHRASHVNRPMAEAAQAVEDVAFIDLYRAYPRYHIDVAAEQDRLLAAEVVLFQFPLFWYSSPSLVKEWLDLVLEHGFAYGSGGDRLKGKSLMLAVTAAGPKEAYTAQGYQNHSLRTFLTPFEQTARLCQMRFLAPYVLHGSLRAPEAGEVAPHVGGYRRLLTALRDDLYDLGAAEQMEVVTYETLPMRGER